MQESRREAEVELAADGKESRDTMLKGSAWMTGGSILSRILGAVYIIPWRIWFAGFFFQANALYVQGYNVYSILLIAAIAGIPSAVAKQVAHYNTLNEYGVGFKLYKRGLLLSISTGILVALILYFSAPFLDNGDGNVIPVMRALSWAILIIPTMSLTRGFFQGYQDMAPSAISQFVEQLVRVAYMLITALLIMHLKVIKGDWITAVSQSTFAAFMGSAAGLLVLGYYYFKRRNYYRDLVAKSDNRLQVNTMQLYKEIIQQAVPFIILGAGILIFQLIDQFTFFDLMRVFRGYPEVVLQQLFAIYAGNANKLVMITISLASALAITVVPLLSKAYTNNDKEGIRREIISGLILFEFIMIPSALGMAAIAGPLNRLFNGTGYGHLSANVLSFYSVVSIVLGLFTVISAMMQGIYQNKLAVKYFIIGTIVKIILQVPAVALFGTFGPLVSTAIGFVVTNFLILHSLTRQFHISYRLVVKRTNQILLFSILTYATALGSVFLFNWILGHFMDISATVPSGIVTFIAMFVGGFVYLYSVLKTRLADQIVGSRISRLRTVLHIK
ncbi:polysaccharide biosynthesis protein [Lactobacillus sp. Sy-1]|uniref:putative polysaccharide biosynthesis protein n=1 Tax=Lactobacillus sp. Sy-1 TaxID=2109645 RepID=UPI001C592D4D|nr:polysaccharide biosynthesis protein [Lactobacillus sp. Sy-1]MBW1605747.1 polysaccharide biosynthesis protein [Lactobacillus sp. Sy-1]